MLVQPMLSQTGMRCSLRTTFQGAITLIECVVVLGVLCLLAVVLHPRKGRPEQAKRIQCLNNLKQIGFGLRTFAVDNGGSYYASSEGGHGSNSLLAVEHPADLWRYFVGHTNLWETPKILACPADTRRSLLNTWACVATNDHNRALSYGLGLDADEERPSTIVSADRNWTLDGLPVGMAILTLTTNHPVGFHTNLHRNAGNVLLGDGSVQMGSSIWLPEMVREAIHARTNSSTMRFVVP